MLGIKDYQNYLFILAHPDDELYCCCLMHQLVEAGKKVSVAYVTSGDAGINAEIREAEISDSMDIIGVSPENTNLLRFSESTVLNSFKDIFGKLEALGNKIKPDCIVTMDYEGAHEGHDSVSFLSYKLAKSFDAMLYVFPVYHAKDGQRDAAEFLPGHKASDVITLKSIDSEVKLKVFEAHKGQIGHFLRLQINKPEYFQLMFSRELFMEVDGQLDFDERPVIEISYESHRNGFKYEDFRKAVNSLN